MNTLSTQASGTVPAVVTSDWLAGIVDTCRKAEVGRVYAANHHGMKFLLADDGPNASGICYRDDSKSYSELAALAAQVNAALSANNKISNSGA